MKRRGRTRRATIPAGSLEKTVVIGDQSTLICGMAPQRALSGDGVHRDGVWLLWRNAGQKSTNETEYYVPYKRQLSAEDFKKFSKLKKIFFENKARQQKLYGNP